MEEWKIVISETEGKQMWINIKQPRLIIKHLKDEDDKKFAIQLLTEEGLVKKLLAKCEKLETAMKWAKDLDIDKLIE